MFVPGYGRSCPCVLAVLLLILFPAAARSQSATVGRDFSAPLPPVRPLLPISIPNQGKTYGLAELTAAAGTIFSGTVTAIVLRPSEDSIRPNPRQAYPRQAVNYRIDPKQAIETVAITFHVDQAIRGVTPGDDFILTEWIGVWSGGQRYRAGERLLLFLYPTSKLGLTSCVGGSLGRFIIDPGGMVHFSAQHLAAFGGDSILAGKSRVTFGDFATAVRHAEPRIVEAE
jgi:hypothetical protein